MESGHELQSPPWLTDLLRQGEVYEVGGSVRDRLMGHQVAAKDRDYLVCSIPIDQLQKLLRRHGDVSLVGKSFGVLKFTPHPEEDGRRVTHDIALPRSEQSTGTGHKDFAVDFDPDLPVERDLLRRDFTMNALAENCATHEVVDPADGKADIETKTLRMVFPNTFREDPLRILRGAQFIARFGLTLDPATRAEMKECAEMVATLSMERVAEELTKLLTLAPKPSVGFQLLQELGVIEVLLPEMEEMVGVDQPGGHHAYPVFEHSLYAADAAKPKLPLRWAALLHDINKPQCKAIDGEKATFYGHDKKGSRTAKRILRRLRYPNELAEDVSTLIERHMFTTDITDKGVRRLIRWLGPELIFDLLDLRRADVIAQGMGGTTEDVDELEQRIKDEINRKSPFGLRDLAINGRDLMAEFDLPPGPRLGALLHYLLECVLDDPARNDRVILLDLSRKYLHDNK